MWCECSQTIWIPKVWWDAPCLILKTCVVWMQSNHMNSFVFMRFILWTHWVWMQPNHTTSSGLVRCILFTFASSLGVNATKPYEFQWFGEMHAVCSCGLIGCQCNQSIGIPSVWWDASCLLLWHHWVWMQPNHRNAKGLAIFILFSCMVKWLLPKTNLMNCCRNSFGWQS